MSVDPAGIVPTSIVPEYCSQCGTELEDRPFEDGEYPWCPGCEFLFAKNPVPAVQVVVHDDDAVLLVEERHLDDELWNFPGGHANPREGPREAVLRELAEETGLRADPGDLSLSTVYHGENPRTDYYLITYALARTDADGTVAPTDDVADAAFWPVEEVLADEDRTRASDRERVAALFDQER